MPKAKIAGYEKIYAYPYPPFGEGFIGIDPGFGGMQLQHLPINPIKDRQGMFWFNPETNQVGGVNSPW